MIFLEFAIVGPICCFLVVVVKLMDGKSVLSLPQPEQLPLMTYGEVHRQGAGAYIAEIVDAHRLPRQVINTKS